MIRLAHCVLCFTVMGSVFLSPRMAHAQYYHNYGRPYARPIYPPVVGPDIDRTTLYLGLGVFGDAIVNQANSGVDFLTSGGGYNFMLGLRLHQNFAIEFGVGEGFHSGVSDAWGNTVDYLALNQLTVDAKVILPMLGLPWRPYLQGGFGYFMLTNAFDDELASGGGFQLGGGIDFWLNPWWSVGGRVLYHGIKFSSFTYAQTGQPNSPFLSTMSFEANVQIHF
jgi:hypothetical protein